MLKESNILELLYHNEETENFIEFEVEGIDDSFTEREIIDAFMEIVKSFDDSSNISLPKELLMMLQDKELDLFLYAAYAPKLLESLSNMIYVVKHDKFIPDQYGTLFKVDYIGKTTSVLSYEQIDSLNMFSVPTQQIENGHFDTKNLSQKNY